MKKVIYFLTVIFCIHVLVNELNAAPGWNVDPSKYQYSMSITGVILFNNIESVDTSDLVAAFSDTICRGVGHPIYIESLNRYMVFLMVYSNYSSQENINFKIYKATSNNIFNAVQTVSFNNNELLGMLNYPFKWSNNILNNHSDFLSFSIVEQIKPEVIDIINKTITLTVTTGTNVTELVPVYAISSGAIATVSDTIQESGVSTHNFTSPIIYRVTAEDGISFSLWTVKIEFSNGIDEHESVSFFLYPNPAKSIFRLSMYTNNAETTVNLYNITGKNIFMEKINNSGFINKTYYIDDLPSGIYFFSIQNDSHRFCKKLIID